MHYIKSGYILLLAHTRTCTVVWEIFACNNFRMLKFRMGTFSYNNGCSKFERAKRDFRFKYFLLRYIRKEQGVHACHGGVRKGLLYSRLPRIQRDMAGSYSICTDHLRDLAVCSSNRS